MGRLDVTIIGCRNLVNIQAVGTIDPYVIVVVENAKFDTKVATDTTNPKWDETFKFHIADPNSAQVKIQVWNKNLVSDDFLGDYCLSVSHCVQGQPQEHWCLLKQAKGNPEIGFRLHALDFGLSASAATSLNASANNVPVAAASSLNNTTTSATATTVIVTPTPAPLQQQQQPVYVPPSTGTGFAPPPPGFWFPTYGGGGGGGFAQPFVPQNPAIPVNPVIPGNPVIPVIPVNPYNPVIPVTPTPTPSNPQQNNTNTGGTTMPAIITVPQGNPHQPHNNNPTNHPQGGGAAGGGATIPAIITVPTGGNFGGGANGLPGYQPGGNPTNIPNIPMPTGPSALPGWVPPIPGACMIIPGSADPDQRHAVTKCRNGHPLTDTAAYDEKNHTLWCDLCYHKCVGNSGAKQCRQCDVDICLRCSQNYSKMPPVPKCPKGHGLVPNQGREGTWGCDRCTQGGKNGSMRCRTCDFDICDKCFLYYIADQWKNLK